MAKPCIKVEQSVIKMARNDLGSEEFVTQKVFSFQIRGNFNRPFNP